VIQAGLCTKLGRAWQPGKVDGARAARRAGMSKRVPAVAGRPLAMSYPEVEPENACYVGLVGQCKTRIRSVSAPVTPTFHARQSMRTELDEYNLWEAMAPQTAVRNVDVAQRADKICGC
jgi:hypothetical protein